MTKSKKISMLLFGFMLVMSSFLFAACGKLDYSKTYLTTSKDYIEIFVGNETNVTVTINNPVSDMSKLISFTSSSPSKCDIVETSHQGYSTTYTITGSQGGSTTIDFTAIDGGASASITVVVREYSNSLEAKTDGLYVTKSQPLVPTEENFVFSDNTTERELEFYFYGIKTVEELSLENVKQDGELINRFVSVELIENGTTDKKYLIFKDHEDNLYTLQTPNASSNRFNFVAVSKSEEVYTLPRDAYAVSAGEKYAFVARYVAVSESETEYCADREFSILEDIFDVNDENKFAHTYGYKNYNYQFDASDENSYITLEEKNTGIVTFVPYYFPTVEISGDEKQIDFRTSYVKIVQKGINPLLKVEAYSNNKDIVTGKLIRITDIDTNKTSNSIIDYDSNTTTYWLELNCANGSKSTSSFVLHFYYEGFKDSTDKTVSYRYEIPVEIRNIPSDISINGLDTKNNSQLYTFYNHYASNTGWQIFRFAVNPADAEYKSFTIDLAGSGLKARYQNVEYVPGENNFDGLLEIKDLSQTVYLKGIEEATPTAEPKELPIKLKIDVIGEQTLEFSLKYQIKQGAKTLTLDEDYLDGIYIDSSITKNTLENILVADADFEYITVKHIGGPDVAAISLGEKVVYDGDVYFNLNISPKETNEKAGVYQVALDNGISTTVKVYVIETLKSIFIETTDENNLLKVPVEETGSNESTYYIYNKIKNNQTSQDETNFLDFHVYSNGNRDSKAITFVDCGNVNSASFEIQGTSADGREFDIRIKKNGSQDVVVYAKGWTIGDDFKPIETEVSHILHLIAYNYIDGINVVNADDEVVNYASVYTGINNIERRQTTFSVKVLDENNNGYLFYNPQADGSFTVEKEEFRKEFIYWEIVGKNEFLSYENPLIDVAGLGTFSLDENTGEVTFASALRATRLSFTLLAHVKQYEKVFTHTVKGSILNYNEVQGISSLEEIPDNKLTFSSARKSIEIIIAPINAKKVTDPTIVYLFKNGTNLENMFNGENGSVEAIYDEGTGNTRFILSLSDDYITELSSEEHRNKEYSATITFAAKDWVSLGAIITDYKGSEINLTINFETGAKDNPITIDNAEELLAIKQNPSAYYRIASVVDASSIVEHLPLGEFKGSLVGTKDYAKIVGLNFTEKNHAESVGLFTSVAGTIENLGFEGSFNWKTIAGGTTLSNVGIIAGTNSGTIKNVNVKLKASSFVLNGGKFGGLVGENTGTISQDFAWYEEVIQDANKNNITRADQGFSPKTLMYTNDTILITTSTGSTIGGVAGTNSGTIQTIRGTKVYLGLTNYISYVSIEQKGLGLSYIGAIAGNGKTGTIDGTTVGGLVSGYGYVGGVVGTAEDSATIQDVTTRTFVRAREGSAALVGNINDSTGNISNIKVQAVDDGRLGVEASMGINYGTEKSITLQQSIFGFETKLGTSLFTAESFVERTLEDIDVGNYKDNPVVNLGKESYFGDYILVVNENSKDYVASSVNFEKGTNTQEMSVEANFGNNMTAESGKLSVFYTYFFKVDSFALENLKELNEWENSFERELNTLSFNNQFYPFITQNVELTFKSQSPDVLTIDENGTITLKSTGLALINVTSLLNSNNGASFYIYVVNYINNNQSSIVYPNNSSYSTPVDKTTVELRGDNSANFYVIPSYDFVKENESTVIYTSNKYGYAIYQGIAFNLQTNAQVSANVAVYNDEIDESDDNNSNIISTVVTGQTIEIGRGESPADKDGIKLIIQPIIKATIENVDYIANVNKQLQEIVVNYRRGAIDITNEKYINASIYSSTIIEDVVAVKSTAETEKLPIYEIVGLDGKTILSKDDCLFTVSINPRNGDKVDQSEMEVGDVAYYNHLFDIEISINKDSTAYKDRYKENIYGKYVINFYAESNESKLVSINIYFGKTDISSVPVDNYTVLKKSTFGTGLPSKSEVAYPGESGLLAITVSPDDADYDKIIIENDNGNFAQGKASAIFSLLARKTTGETDDCMFADETILGAQTAKGIEINLQDLINVYDKSGYEKYNGVIYIRYDFSSENVLNNSKSIVHIKFMKNGQLIEETKKELTIKLQQFVGIELVGKEKTQDQSNYYSAYTVARGLKYEIRVNSYGFASDKIAITSLNSNLGQIVYENGKYYLVVTADSLTTGNSFEISVAGKDGERTATSLTKIVIKDFVFNYSDSENAKKPDIVAGMGNGIINIQVGSKKNLAIDLYKYIEYDETNPQVVSLIELFMKNLAKTASWTAITNLKSDLLPDAGKTPDEVKKNYNLGYNIDGSINKNQNYYFQSDGLSVIPVHTHKAGIEKFYYFTMKVGYKDSGTNYSAVAVLSEEDKHLISTEFVFEVYTSSSEESPIPIDSYDDFKAMKEGGYYILMNDIVLPAGDFKKPLNGNFASLDGNGYTVHFAGTYDMGESNELGLFATISSDTIVKNLTVDFCASNTVRIESGSNIKDISAVVFKTEATSFTFGGITPSNAGIITNCHILTSNKGNIFVDAENALSRESHIAGLVGLNNGFITNCTVNINIESSFYISGVVARNSGKIAATSFTGGKLIGYNAANTVSGFTYINEEEGQIITSYVSGVKDSKSLVSTGATLTATQPAAGFAYNNLGTIKDCYSDINISESTDSMAGFVFANSGTIRNAFSLSKVKSHSGLSAGFAYSNIVDGKKGTIVNCFYYYDNAKDYNIDLAGADEGITKLTEDEFGQHSKYFADFSYTTDLVNAQYSVWVYSEGVSSSVFTNIKKSVYEVKNGNVSESTSYAIAGQKTFAKGRLELVAANIETISRREKLLEEGSHKTEIDPDTGDIKYFYKDINDEVYPAKGDIHNPILISSAKNMEAEILENSSATNLNTSNYRIVSDINYNEVEGYSMLSKVIFAGVMEGNGMKIDSIGLVSMDNADNAGMFAQIGYAADKQGSVKNLSISPREVAYSSTSSVGTLAGVLDYGYVFDINVAPAENAKITVSGKNFVGGIVGRAINKYEIKDVYSSVNATASHSPKNNDSYSDIAVERADFSYAGAIAGYVGNGKVYNAHVQDVNVVMGGRAGFAYGGLGMGADVNYTFVDILDGSIIRAYQYAGYVAGEICGKLSYASVEGEGATQATFAVVPKAADAIGGITGRLDAGKINDVVMTQPFVSSNNDSGNVINNIGGLVGVVETKTATTAMITNAIVSADITTCSSLGGAVGLVNSALSMDSVAVKSKTLTVKGEKSNPVVGGLIAKISDKSNGVSITNSYCSANINIDTYTAGVQSIGYASGFIADNDGASLTMKSCYTTTKINALIQDIRNVGEEKEFSESAPNVSFNQRRTETNMSEVYYLGSNSVGSGANGYSESTKNYVTFEYKANLVTMGLVVNQYGTSSQQYAFEEGEKAFNGLFGVGYDYYDEKENIGFHLRKSSTTGNLIVEDELSVFLADFTWNSNGYSRKIPCEEFDDMELTGEIENTLASGKVIYTNKVLKYKDKEVAFTKAAQKIEIDGKTYTWQSGKNAFVGEGENITIGQLYIEETIDKTKNGTFKNYDFGTSYITPQYIEDAQNRDLRKMVEDSNRVDAFDYPKEIDINNMIPCYLYRFIDYANNGKVSIYKRGYNDSGVIIYTNIENGNKLSSAVDDDKGKIDSLTQIWRIDETTLTTLEFEYNLEWLKKA